MPRKRQLKAQLHTINKTDAGYVISAAPHRGLVLSGGGAKGVAYAGMINAMYERDFIQQLSHVSGASAGAIVASFLAIGMNAESIEKLALRLDIRKLLKENYGLRAIGERFRNMLEVIYIQQIKLLMTDLDVLQTQAQEADYSLLLNKIRLYDTALAKKGIVLNCIDDVIALGDDLIALRKLDAAFIHLPTQMHDRVGALLESPRITFSDLARLRRVLPQDQQHLIKHLSVVTTNQSKNKLETYNEDLSPDASIAEKVQESSAHPVLFSPRRNALKHYIADGGILDNMPTRVLEHAGLNKEEILCVRAESDGKFKKRILRAQVNTPESSSGLSDTVDDIASYLLGGRVFKSKIRVNNREKIFHHIGNMLYLNTGCITTTTTSATAAQKKQAIDTAYQQTHDLLNENNKVFSNPLMAMLYLGVDKLDETLISESLDELLIHAAINAKKIFLLQDNLVREMNLNIFDVDDYIKDIKDILKIDADLDERQQVQALALCLKQVDHYSEGQFERYMAIQVAKETAAQKVTWLRWLLDLLWAPIDWVLSLFKTQKTQPAHKSISSAMSTLGLFVPRPTDEALEGCVFDTALASF